MIKKITSMLLVSTLIVGNISVVFATDTGTNKGLSGEGSDVPAVLTAEQLSFNVTVPTILPVNVDSSGITTVAQDVKVINNSNGPVKITGMHLDSQSDWKLVDYATNFSYSKVGIREYGFQILGSNADNITGNCNTDGYNPIAGNSSITLNYNANIAPQNKGLSDEVIAKVVFTVGWDTMVDGGSDGNQDKHDYVIATDSDFSGKTDGSFKYIGTDKYVEVPHVIKGIPVASYQYMFTSTSVEGVKSTNTNVTNMQGMFYNSAATTLDLSSFDTSNVTHMSYMFQSSKATTLDLSSFDTSRVTNMMGMFYGSAATTLDLSSFNTSNVLDMGAMFYNSAAATGYARTQSDANKFNTSFNKPPTLTFIVK